MELNKKKNENKKLKIAFKEIIDKMIFYLLRTT